MGLSTPDDDGVRDHLLLIDNIGSSLNKICVDGKISIEDIKKAALTSSLPSSFTSVTSHFERQATVSYKAVSDAVRSAVINNKNRTAQPSVMSTANSVKALSRATTSSAPRPLNSNKESQRGRRRDPSQQCDHCKSINRTVNRCLKKQNDDLKDTIDSPVKKVDAIGKAKMVREDEDSDYSDSMAWSASIAVARQTTGSMWNLDSACSNTLVTPTTEIANRQPSSLTLRTADSSVIKASVSGSVQLPIRGLGDIKAHVIPNLAEPLLSVSDLTDKDKAVVFLKTRALIVDQPVW